MSAEFSVDYDLVMDAANRFDAASGEFKDIIRLLQQLSDQLQGTWFVGLTGNAAAKNIAFLQNHLQQLVAKSDEMRQDLLNTVQEFRDDVDPGMAARFDG
jgi:uncharacterized protein YukE